MKILNDIQLHLKIISRILNTSHAIKQKVTSEVYRSLMQIKLSDLKTQYVDLEDEKIPEWITIETTDFIKVR